MKLASEASIDVKVGVVTYTTGSVRVRLLWLLFSMCSTPFSTLVSMLRNMWSCAFTTTEVVSPCDSTTRTARSASMLLNGAHVRTSLMASLSSFKLSNSCSVMVAPAAAMFGTNGLCVLLMAVPMMANRLTIHTMSNVQLIHGRCGAFLLIRRMHNSTKPMAGQSKNSAQLTNRAMSIQLPNMPGIYIMRRVKMATTMPMTAIKRPMPMQPLMKMAANFSIQLMTSSARFPTCCMVSRFGIYFLMFSRLGSMPCISSRCAVVLASGTIIHSKM